MSDRALSAAIVILRGDRTQATMALRAQLVPAVWNMYESGQRTPIGANLRKVLRGLGCCRLELEEVRWQILRTQLRQEAAPADFEASQESLAGEVIGGVRETDEEARARPRLHVQRMLLQLVSLVEELVVAGPGGNGRAVCTDEL